MLTQHILYSCLYPFPNKQAQIAAREAKLAADLKQQRQQQQQRQHQQRQHHQPLPPPTTCPYAGSSTDHLAPTALPAPSQAADQAFTARTDSSKQLHFTRRESGNGGEMVSRSCSSKFHLPLQFLPRVRSSTFSSLQGSDFAFQNNGEKRSSRTRHFPYRERTAFRNMRS